MLIMMVVISAVFIVLVAGLMSAMDRWLSVWVAIGFGICAFAYVVYTMVGGIIHCAAEPIYIPPTATDAAIGSEGSMQFNCDSAGGVVDRVFLYLMAPLTMVALGALTLKYYRKVRPE